MTNTPLNPDALAQLIMWKELPFGGNPDNYIRLDANAAHKVIELLKSHLAVAQPVVNSVEELDALPVGSVIRGEEDDLVSEKIRHSPYLPYWVTTGEEEEADKRDLLPARVLYRPEVKP